MKSARRFLLVLAVAALAVAALQGATGLMDLAFYAGPVFLIVALLLGGRFVGEDWIASRVRAASAPRRAPALRRWAPGHERSLASLLDRSACLLRGPPLLVAA